MMRMLAWWAITQATSSGLRPLASSAVFDAGRHVAHGVLVDLAPVHLHEVPLVGDGLGRRRLAAAARGLVAGCR